MGRKVNRHLLGAFAAMLFVGASWGANVPVTKVMLGYFDLMPMAAMRTAAATAALAVLLWLVEGRRALRIDLPFGRFAALGFMMGGFFAVYAWAFTSATRSPRRAGQRRGSAGVGGDRVAGHAPGVRSGVRRRAVADADGGPDPGLGQPVRPRTATFRGGEIIVLLSNGLWTLYSHQGADLVRPREPAPPRLCRLAVGAGLADPGRRVADRARLVASAVRRRRQLGLDPAPRHRGSGERAGRLFLEHRRRPARRGRSPRCGSIWCRFSPSCGRWRTVSCRTPTRSSAAWWR